MAKYSEEIVDRIVELISLDSYTIAEICKNVGISKDTYYRWMKEYSDFSDTIKRAQSEFDDFIVTEAKKSLVKKIQGYTVEETKTVYIEKPTKDGEEQGKPKIKEKTVTKKYIQPDTVALIFALTNKDPENWKNRQSNEHTGKDGEPSLDKLEVVIVRNKKDIEDAKK